MSNKIVSLEDYDDEVYLDYCLWEGRLSLLHCILYKFLEFSILWWYSILSGNLLDRHRHLPRFLPHRLQQQPCYCMSNILWNQFMPFYHLTLNRALKKCNKYKGICYGSYNINYTYSWTQKGALKYFDNTWDRLWLYWNLNSALKFLPNRDIALVLQSGL